MEGNVREIGVESQDVSCDAVRMRLLVVDPSPLVRNVYRLLLQQYAPEASVVACESLLDLSHIDGGDAFAACIIGSKAIAGEEGERCRALLTDASPWATLPKLVVTMGRASEQGSGQLKLPHSTRLERPFTPEAFAACLDEVIDGETA